MSYTYRLLTAQTPYLPASYGIDITATPTSGVPLTRSFVIEAVSVADPQTVRSLHDLLTVLFADGQLPDSITAQDCRDMVVSLSLETADLSALPTSSAGLASGRVYVDNNVFRVVP